MNLSGEIKMSEIMTFNNQIFGQIRTILVNEEPYFCLIDLCKCLDLNNTSQVKSRLDIYGVISNEVIDSLGRKQEATFINEPNLYKVIFQSKKASAEKFQNWVYRDVLPQIRKNGIYSNTPKSFKEALYLAYKQQEKIEYLEKTKAWISDKKTATAMNTASQKSKEVKRLEIELDKSKEYASVKLIQTKTGKKYNWKDLKNYCITVGLEIKKAQDSNYGEVNSYPARAWKEVYKIEIKEII